MKPVYLVSCVSQKAQSPCLAKDMYQSPWFLKARNLAERESRMWFILSAKYGLVYPDRLIEPYDLALQDMDRVARRDWTVAVQVALGAFRPRVIGPGTKVLILAGRIYRRDLRPWIEAQGGQVEVPMRGLGIGEQLGWMKKIADQKLCL